MPHNTAPATSGSGIPGPIEGTGPSCGRQETLEQGRVAWTAVAAPMQNAPVNVDNLIPHLPQISQISLAATNGPITTKHNVTI